jgi:acyl-CoA thioester hydrolase
MHKNQESVKTSRIGNSSMQITTEIYLQDELLINAELTYVYANTTTKKSTPIPAEWRTFLHSEVKSKE